MNRDRGIDANKSTGQQMPSAAHHFLLARNRDKWTKWNSGGGNVRPTVGPTHHNNSKANHPAILCGHRKDEGWATVVFSKMSHFL